MKRLDEFFAQLAYDFVTWPSDRRRRRMEIAPLARQRELNYRAVSALLLATGFTLAWGAVKLVSKVELSPFLNVATAGLFGLLNTVFVWVMWYAWVTATWRVAHAYLFDSQR